jgi:disulfide bond formation protein DsbB
LSTAIAMLSSRTSATLILLASIAVIGIALLSQYVGGLQPCELCLYERWPYYAVILMLGLTLPSRSARLHRVALGFAAAIFAAGAALGFYHAGVERHWFQGPTACTGGGAPAASVEALQRALEGRQPVQCDVPQWSFHGITLAGLDFVASAALSLVALYALWRPPKRGWQ